MKIIFILFRRVGELHTNLRTVSLDTRSWIMIKPQNLTWSKRKPLTFTNTRLKKPSQIIRWGITLGNVIQRNEMPSNVPLFHSLLQFTAGHWIHCLSDRMFASWILCYTGIVKLVFDVNSWDAVGSRVAWSKRVKTRSGFRQYPWSNDTSTPAFKLILLRQQ